jgi:ribosomal protein S18 acetylase RimI-like enzyme
MKMMNITIAEFTIEAFEQVYSLWNTCDGIGLSAADSRDNIRAYLDRNPGMSLLAWDESNIVASILCGHDGRRGYIHHLAVHPEYRRQGLGGMLVEKSIAALASAGIQKCHIFIFNDNAAGSEFWESIGWTYRRDIGVISKDLH